MRTRVAVGLTAATFALIVSGCDPFGGGSDEPDEEAACSTPRRAFVPQAWTTDDSIESIAVHCDTIYVAGAFESIGPRTGPLASVSLDGSADPSVMPRLWNQQRFDATTSAPRVTSVVTDGAGGWFIAGSFDFVGDQHCPGVVHLLQSGRVDPDVCFGTDGTVKALAVSGSTLYLGGEFAQVAGVHRSGVAAVDARSGAVLSWAPELNERSICDDHDCVTEASVNSLAVTPGAVYVGGFFNGVGGIERTNVAALDPRTGVALSFDAGIREEEDYFGEVEAVAVADDAVYVSCPYCNERGADEPVHRLDADSGLSLGAIDIDGPATVLTVQEGILCVGGSFSQVASSRRSGIAAFDAASSELLAWKTGLRPGTSVSALTRQGNLVLLATDATSEEYRDSSGSVQGFRITPVDARSGRVRPGSVDANERILALGVSGRVVVAGGDFSGVGVKRRDGLAAIDGVRGTLLEWAPRTGADPWEHPQALLVADGRLYVGGSITQIDAERRQGLASFELATRKLTPWNPLVADMGDPFFDGVVALAEDDGTIYVGGDFTRIDGIRRLGAAAIDAESSDVLDWNPDVRQDPGPRIELGAVDGVAIDDGRVYIGGGFEDVAGVSRGGLAAVDESSGELEEWNPDPRDYAWVDTILPSEDGAFVGGWFGEIGGRQRVAVALLDSEGAATSFDARLDTGSIHGPVLALAEYGSWLFVAGNFQVVAGESRQGFAAVDSTSGRLLDWDLDRADQACSPTSLAVGGDALVVDGYISECGNLESGNVEQLVVQPLPPSP
ncbi:MAG: hypothetical protein M3Q59_01040 [Actinomycetota bacterium]|nr:hypothetical protein [Actinomycetota bacterium]